eukprot:364872-Chlamydomonas_euryale.AAC.4
MDGWVRGWMGERMRGARHAAGDPTPSHAGERQDETDERRRTTPLAGFFRSQVAGVAGPQQRGWDCTA